RACRGRREAPDALKQPPALPGAERDRLARYRWSGDLRRPLHRGGKPPSMYPVGFPLDRRLVAWPSPWLVVRSRREQRRQIAAPAKFPKQPKFFAYNDKERRCGSSDGVQQLSRFCLA